MLLKQKSWLIGLFQACVMILYPVFLYITFFSFMRNLTRGGVPGMEIYMSAFVLTALVVSVLISGLITLAIPAYLMLNNNFKKGIQVLVFTVIFLVLLLSMLVAYLYRAKMKSGFEVSNSFAPAISREEGLEKAEQAKEKADEYNLQYEQEFQENKSAETLPAAELNLPSPGVAPYKVDINTGERTPLE